MARETLIKGERRGRPNIVVAGQSNLDGRMSTLLRVRPTLMQELRSVSVGPAYLMIEFALQELIRRAKDGEEITIYAEDMAPTKEDQALLAQARKDAAKRQAAKEKGPRAKPKAA